MSMPVDTLYHRTASDDKVIYLPDNKPLFHADNVKFSNKFHGSVPKRICDKIRELALKDYNISIDKNDLRREQRLDPIFRDLITYLEHMIMPVNKHHARRILNLEDHYCMIGDILFHMPKCDNPFDDNKLRLQLVIPDTLAN